MTLQRTATRVRLFEVEKLGIATEGGHIIGYRGLDDYLSQVVGATGRGTRSREAVPPKGIAPNHGTYSVSIDVQVAD